MKSERMDPLKFASERYRNLIARQNELVTKGRGLQSQLSANDSELCTVDNFLCDAQKDLLRIIAAAKD